MPQADSSGIAETPLQSIQEAQAWDQRAVELPKKWPTAKYAFIWLTMRGHVELKNEAFDLDGKMMLRLTDSYSVQERLSGKKAIDTTYTTVCKLDRYLTPVSVKSHGDHYEHPKGSVDHKFESGKLIGRYAWGKGDVKEAQSDLPSPFVLDVALTRVAALMPFVNGAELKFNFVTTDGYPERDHILRCLGKEEITVNERNYKAWKFEHPGERFDTDYFWISENRILLTAEFGGGGAIHKILELIDNP